MEQQRAYRRTPARRRNSILRLEWVRLLLFYILPFVVINLIIFFLVTTKPSYEVTIANTNDYRTTDVTFTITSFMPLRNVTITLDGEPLDLTPVGRKSYQSTVTRNGVLEIHMENFNHMAITGYEVIDVLDNELPDVTSYTLADGQLTLWLSDTQSGIDYESLSAVTGDGREIAPLSIDKNAGTAVFEIDTTGLTVTIKDMSGNEYQPAFSLTEIIEEADNDAIHPAE